MPRAEQGPGDAHTGVVSASAAVQQLRDQVASQEAQRPQGRAQAARIAKAAPSVIKPRSFVKELRARLRVVEREIKAIRRLEDEAVEIRRLIAAATEPAKVLNIARKSG